MQLEPGVRIGKYEVGKKLGQGGFGVLYTARDTKLDRDVAIKILRPEHVFKPQVVQRFLQEAKAAARINHPGIVTVFESGEVSGTNTLADGTVYIAMELLAGDTLAHRIKQNGRLPFGIAIGFCRQMADALAAAHMANIVHRDLKPANIFLVRDPAVVGGERVKVLDFGIAKLADNFGGNVQTHSLVMLGTPMYMSPEQCKSSAKVDARSDIYTLGCILFEMLCGRTPFDGDSGELIAKHQLVAPPTARSLMSELPDDLDRLISSMLAKSADERPQTMTAVIDVLDAIEDRFAPEPEMTNPEHVALDIANMTTVASTARTKDSLASKLRSRTGMIGIAALAITLGVCGGVVAMRGGDKSASAKTTAKDDSTPDKGSAVAVETGSNGQPTEPPPPTVDPTASAELDQLVIECRRYATESKWTECNECVTKVAKIDRARATDLEPVCDVPEIDMTDDVIASPNGGPKTGTKTKTATTATTAKKDSVKAPDNCDAEAAKEKGMNNINMGQHAAAHAQFEASLRCKDDPYVRQLAFMEACASGNSPKAKYYYPLLTKGQQEKFGQICERQKPPVDYKVACNAEVSKEKGMSYINMGQHENAFIQFETSLACKDDPYVRQLAFMEACASGNEKKAKAYYKKLTPAQQTKFAQICIRQKPPVPYE